MKKLLSPTGTLPYLLVVVLNAFVDLGHKITLQNTLFTVYDGTVQIVLSAIINGLILLPFIVLFAPAGYLADRFAKHRVIRASALAAIFITLGITGCYYLGWFWAAFGLTLLLAVQSAIYSPAKYGYIKLLFGKEQLAEANGLVQALTIGAILLGTLAFSVLFSLRFPTDASAEQGLIAIAPLGWILVTCSIVECVAAYRLPMLEKPISTDVSEFKCPSLRSSIAPVLNQRVIFLSVIGLAMFWSVGQVMLAAFPAFAKETLQLTSPIVIQSILAATGIGIAIGSSLAGKWSKSHVETGLIPVGALGISMGLLVLPQLQSATALFVDFLLIGVAGGLFIVPLNALLQFNARDDQLGKVLAGNNLIQNACMLLFLVITVGFALAGFSSRWLLHLTGIVALAGTVYTLYQLPQSLIRTLLAFTMTRRYKVDVQGLKNLPSDGGVLLLGNHISWIDWAMVQIASPRPIRFVMLRSIYERWYLKHFLKLLGCIPIEQGASSKRTLTLIAELLDQGEVVCLFPEGAISRNGHLGEFRQGFERACEQTSSDIRIVPFYLSGLWGSQFSRASDQLRRLRRSGFTRDVIVSFGKPLSKDTKADVVKRRVFDLSIEAWNQHIENQPTLPAAWIDTCKRKGSNLALVDTMGSSLSANRALTGALALSRRIKHISREDTVGLLLPTGAAGTLTNLAALLCNKTVVHLNYTASPEAIASAIQQSGLKTLYTSQRFIDKLKRKGIDLDVVLQNTQLIEMEELSANISPLERGFWWLTSTLLPAWCIKALYCQSSDNHRSAAVLFSSGSEGSPKGIMLSHRNIMANIKQVSDVLNTRQDDVVMASLPSFHAFGLTVTQFLPLIEGLPMVCHADPTDVVNIAKAAAKHRATILCGTSTFLRLFASNRKVHPLILDSLRVVVSGAERLNPEVRQAFEAKFNKAIYEGYGATETSPVASVNLPDQLDNRHWKVQTGQRLGSVGMPLPGTGVKIVDPETEQELPTGEAGMILIGGPQVMEGYLHNPEKTASVIRQYDNQRWYITGDKGKVDSDGFLTIIDRYSRFAKIGGEMVSLSRVEQLVCEAAVSITADEERELMAVTIADAKKGEAIVILSNRELESSAIREQLLSMGINALSIPSHYLKVDELPKLGTGKADYSRATQLARDHLKLTC